MSEPPISRGFRGRKLGGYLRELFALDMTAAEIVCDGCGAVAEIGAVRDYGGAIGAILRCEHCDTVVMRLTHTPVGLWLDMRWLFVAAVSS